MQGPIERPHRVPEHEVSGRLLVGHCGGWLNQDQLPPSAICSPSRKCPKAAIEAYRVYADALCFDVLLFTIFSYCMKTVLGHRKPCREVAFSEISSAELWSRRRSYAAKLLPITNLGIYNRPYLHGHLYSELHT